MGRGKERDKPFGIYFGNDLHRVISMISALEDKSASELVSEAVINDLKTKYGDAVIDKLIGCRNFVEAISIMSIGQIANGTPVDQTLAGSFDHITSIAENGGKKRTEP